MPTTTFHIVGDAFVDLLCFLDDSSNGGLPQVGGDSRLEQPVTAVAGGSGLNTTTHLQALLLQSTYNGDGAETTSCSNNTHLAENNNIPSSSSSCNILLHTALNPHDQYGQILVEHAQQHGFPLLNCRRHQEIRACCHDENDDNERSHSNNGNKKYYNSDNSSTGHCVIIISGGERSFMTHVGCLENFKASHVDMNRILDDAKSGRGPIHIHIAGYFNLEGFHDGNLATTLLESSIRRQAARQSSPTDVVVVSLVAQHDATDQWDGGLVDHVMPLLDFLIVNELEASRIVQRGRQRQGESVDRASTATMLEPDEWISYFGSIQNAHSSNNNEQSPCIVVVTRGAQGAMAFCNGTTIAKVQPTVPVPVVVDPTGAGDAFAAGFLHGIWAEQTSQDDKVCTPSSTGTQRIEWSAKAIQQGLLWGCAMGTATVSIRGASIPPQHEAILDIYEKQKQLLE